LFDSFNNILEKDKRYKVQAYTFVMAALDVAQKQTKKTKHVSGRELCQGFKTLAQSEFGLMAKTVLESWGIRTTDDIGEIIYNMIDEGMMGKTDEDKKEDFHNVFGFDQVFLKEYPFTQDDGFGKHNERQDN
jgi:uncharacterized repeat protein (TIGR04138 family)